MATANQNPEQLARDQIDQRLLASAWLFHYFEHTVKRKNTFEAKQSAAMEHPLRRTLVLQELSQAFFKL
jgi:hypothetical protein